MPTGAESSAIFFDYRAVRAEVKALTEDFSDGPHQVYENLKEMLEQAELTGDKQLARAVYHRAIDVGASEVIERFIASRPKDKAAYRNYVEATQEAQRASGFEHLLTNALTQQQLDR
jgi:hypothetical protein